MEENTGEGETEGAHRSTVCGEGGGGEKTQTLISSLIVNRYTC